MPLEGDSLTDAADTYFRQSEQLPTFIRLAVARHYRPGQQATGRGPGAPAGCWCRSSPARAAAPRHGRRPSPRRTGRAPRLLAETVEDHELLDPLLPPDRLLYRLFHEEQVRAFRAIPLESYCSCSRGRVEDLLKRFSAEDLADMVVDGEVWVTCEFCNSRYSFDPASFADA